MTDLSKFVNKEVQVTFRDDTMCTGKVILNDDDDFTTAYPYVFHSSQNTWTGSRSYTGFGELSICVASSMDIINIEEFKLMETSQEIESQIAELQKELVIVKEKEKSEFLPQGFKRDFALKLLSNPTIRDLNYAFEWDTTPQDVSYWNEIYCNLDDGKITKLPDDAIIQIQRWVITSYRKQLGE